MKIRNLKYDEINFVSKIVGKNYSKVYERSSKQEFGAMFSNPVIPPNYLVAENNGHILGCCGYIQSWMDYGVYQIYWVNVLPKHQGNGIGTSLVNAAIKRIKSIRGNGKATMILLTAKGKNVGFYRTKFGFKKLHWLDEDEYLMGLSINDKIKN